MGLDIFGIIGNTWLTAMAGPFLRLWDFWLVEEEQEQEPGDNNSYLSARKVPAKNSATYAVEA